MIMILIHTNYTTFPVSTYPIIEKVYPRTFFSPIAIRSFTFGTELRVGWKQLSRESQIRNLQYPLPRHVRLHEEDVIWGDFMITFEFLQ
jgi:hypothetical protein